MRTFSPKLAYILWFGSLWLWGFAEAQVMAAEAPARDPFDLNAEIQSGLTGQLRRATSPIRHFSGLSSEQVQARAAEARNREALLGEKLQGKWFAALLRLNGPEPLSIATRFESLKELSDFITTTKPLVEVWSDPGGTGLGQARRLTAHEVAALQNQEAESPTWLTLTFRDPATGQVNSNKVEFGFNASARAMAVLQEADRADHARPRAEAAAAPILTALHLAAAGASFQGPTNSPGLAAKEGGVIEDRVVMMGGVSRPAPELESDVYSGAKAFDERFRQTLDDLLEWRHYLEKKALGLPMSPAELEQVAGLLEDLGGKGIWIDDGDALVDVDGFNNSFVYRRYVEGQPRLVKVTGVPSRADVIHDVAKAEASRRFELQQKAALSPSGDGLALIHRVQEVNGRLEIGPLILSEDRADGIDALLSLLDRLPVSQRARLQFDGFSRTLVSADFDGTGSNEQFYFTLQFPPGKALRRERINPLTGEREALFEEGGLLVKIVTDKRLTELEYNANREEASTRTYANTGSRLAPSKGSLLEETRTLEVWQRDLTEPRVDAALPSLLKSKVNHVTGETTREIYGLFPSPVATLDEQLITYRRFNPYGVLVSAKIFDNGRVEQDYARPLLAKLNDAIIGRERFQLTSTLPPQELSALRTLKGQNYLMTFLCHDLAKEMTKTQTFDNGHWGRKVSESFADRLDVTNVVPIHLTLEYRDDFFSGQIPAKTTQRRGSNGNVLSQTESKSYDPFLRRLVSVELDHTGKSVTNFWDPRWSSPVEQQTAGRITLNHYNHDGTVVTGTTTTSSGEELSRFNARFEMNVQHWQMQRVLWHQPGITSQSQTLTLSCAGRVLAVRTDDTFEKRPVYGPEGIEIAAYVYRKNPASGQFNLLHQQEDNYVWSAGTRNARVQLYVDGKPYHSFRRVSDAEGRTLQDEINETPGLNLKTLITYDGATERPLKAERLQNGQIRWTRLWREKQRQPDGSYLVPVNVVPFWGLTTTEVFRVGDPLGRPISAQLENQDNLRVIAWFDETAIAKTFELRDRHGRPKERFSRHLNAGLEGSIPFDSLDREKLNPWGGAALVESKALLRGTDLPIFSRASGEQVYYDSTQLFETPLYAVDLEGRSGAQLRVRGEPKDHVVTLFRGQLENPAEPLGARHGAEPTLFVESIDLRKPNTRQTLKRSFDRSGNLLDEWRGSLPVAKGDTENDETLFAAFSRAAVVEHFHYRYRPGWLVERLEADGHSKVLSFASQRAGPETTSFSVNEESRRDWVTEVDGIKSAPVQTEASALKNYFFRRMHTTRQKDRNAFMPDCTNVWSAWTATELAPTGEKLFESELTFDAQGHLSVRQIARTSQRGGPAIAMAYQLPEPAPDAWKRLRLTSGPNSFPLDLGGVNNLDGCDYLYFYLQNTNRASWTALFRSVSGQEVRVNPTGDGSAKGEIGTSPVSTSNDSPGLDTSALEGGSSVLAPASLLGRENLVLLSVTNLARAGLDIARIFGATLQMQGKPGDAVKLSRVARLVRESQSLAPEKARHADH